MARISTLLLVAAVLFCFGPTFGPLTAVHADDPVGYAGDRVVRTDYQEECLSEGCSNEEVSELYQSYKEECINEGCSQEEINELGGSPQGAQAMLAEFRRRGLAVRPQDSGVNPTCTGTTTFCIGVFLFCDDHCTFPDGSQPSAYLCGGCFGFWW